MAGGGRGLGDDRRNGFWKVVRAPVKVAANWDKIVTSWDNDDELVESNALSL